MVHKTTFIHTQKFNQKILQALKLCVRKNNSQNNTDITVNIHNKLKKIQGVEINSTTMLPSQTSVHMRVCVCTQMTYYEKYIKHFMRRMVRFP